MSRAKSPVHVVIYGRHSVDWMQALDPAAPVWKLMPEVAAVTLLDESGQPPSADGYGDDPPVLIPLMEAHTRSRPTGFRELSPDAVSVDVLADKRRFADYVARHRLEALAPARFLRPEDVRFPAVLKRADLNAGFGIVVLHNRAQLDMLLSLPAWQGVDYVLQAFIDDPLDVVTHCVCRDGAILWSTSLAYELYPETPIRGTVPLRSVRPFAPPREVLREIARFLAPLGYTGPCNVDYKIGPSGELCLLEINPRLGGSLMMPENVYLLRALLGCIVENAAVARPPATAAERPVAGRDPDVPPLA